MTPRPRTVSDERILEAAARAIGRLGPARFTLADVAGEVGLAAATLVQRFGSKRGLMLALARSAGDGVDVGFRRLRAAHPSALDALRVAATHMARMVESPESLANHLAFLQIDLADPEFRAFALASHRGVEAGYRALLDDAVAGGEMAPCDTARVARALGATAGGSLIAWAITRDGGVVDHVRADVETLLAPYVSAVPSPPARAGSADGARADTRPRRRR